MKSMIVVSAVFALIGFLSGSVMFSYLIPKVLKNIDIREEAPDHNPGGANAIRFSGPCIGLICIALDILKAFIPVYIATEYVGITGILLTPVVTAPVLGHAYSVFMHFSGGKAVSPTFGALLGVWPVSKIVMLLIFCTILFKFAAVVRPDSSGICVSMCATFLTSLFFEPLINIKLAFFVIAAVVVRKMIKNPDKGEFCLSLGHHIFNLENSRLKTQRH